MITFVPREIKLWVNTEHGVGLVLYVETFAQDNDIWTIANQKDGKIRHYNTQQITLSKNNTDEINLDNGCII